MSKIRCHLRAVRRVSRIARLRYAALLGGIAAILAPAPAFATRPSPKDRRELTYFLPRTKVAATVAQQITRCPSVANPLPDIDTRISILDRSVADPAAFVRIDARSGFLAKRTTKLTLRADGTLETFNASTEGQGGAVVAAVIKTAATVGATLIGGPGAGAAFAALAMPVGAEKFAAVRPPALDCTPETAALVARRQTVVDSIALLDGFVEKGTATPDQLALAARNRATLAAIDEDLTLVATPIAFDPKTGDPASIAPKLITHVDYAKWFGTNPSPALLKKLPGWAGFTATLRLDAATLAQLKDGDGSTGPGGDPAPYLIYRRPVPAMLTIAPCTTADPSCAPDAGSNLVASQAVAFPQLSGFFGILIGRGGLFGTREAAAKFDENGAPLELEYGSSSGGEAIAGVIDAGREGFTTLHDAELTNLQRRKDLLTTRKEVDELEKAAAAPAGGAN